MDLFVFVVIALVVGLLGVMAYAHAKRSRSTARQREQARAAYLRDVERDRV